jgi:hypothetical protein
VLEIIGGVITPGGRFIGSVTCGCTGRRRRAGLRISGDHRDRRMAGHDRHRVRNPDGRTMGGRALSLVGRITAQGRNLVGPTEARDPNRIGLITAVRGRSRTDLTEHRRIGRHRRRQGSGLEALMRARRAPINPTNVRRRSLSDHPGMSPTLVWDGSQIRQLAIRSRPGGETVL